MPPSAVLFHFSKPVDFDRFRTRIITRTPWLWSSLYAILSVCFFSSHLLVVFVLFLMMIVDHFSALPSAAGWSFTLDRSIICLYVFTMFDLMINYFCNLQSLIQQSFSPFLWISPSSFFSNSHWQSILLWYYIVVEQIRWFPLQVVRLVAFADFFSRAALPDSVTLVPSTILSCFWGWWSCGRFWSLRWPPWLGLWLPALYFTHPLRVLFPALGCHFPALLGGCD